MKTYSRFFIIFFIFFQFVGCIATGGDQPLFGSTTQYRKFNGNIELMMSSEGTFRRVESPNTLFEVYFFSSGPLGSTGWGGYSLFIEIPLEHLQINREIKIPDKNVKALFYSDYHHVGSIREDITGCINIHEMNEDFAILEIDLKINEIDKNMKLKERFIDTEISKYSRIER